MATLNDVKTLAQQLGITFTDHGQVCDLDSSADAPLCYLGTFRKVPSGIDAAYASLVRHQANLEKHQANLGSIHQASTRRRGIGASGALALSLLAALIAYTIGSFAPETRILTGPVTLLCMALMVLSGCVLLFGHNQK